MQAISPSMKSTNPKESLLDEALAADWPIPNFLHQTPSQTANCIDSPVLLRTLLDGGFASKGISHDMAIVPQLKKLSDSLNLSSKLINRLYFLDILYECMKNHAYLDPAVMALVYKLRPTIIKAALNDDNDVFIKSSKHPLRKALNDFCSLGIGWDSSLEKNGDRFFTQLRKLAEVMSSITFETKITSQAYESELNALHELAARYEQIESRLCQSEQGLMESLKNRRIADHTINACTENKKIPALTSQFLHGPWRDALHRILVMHGQNSKDFISASQLMEKLIFCMTPVNDETKQQKYKLIASMRSSLEKHLLNTGNDAEKSHWIDEIESQLQQILMGEKITFEPVTPLTSIEVEGVTALISSAISQQVAQLKPGQWILFKMGNGEVIRSKLAMHAPEAGQLLFVNLLGAKRFSKSIEEFGYALSSKRIYLLTSQNLFNILLTHSAELFVKRYQEHKIKLSETTNIPEPELLKRKSAEKALAEAEKLLLLEKEQIIPVVIPAEKNKAVLVNHSLSGESTPSIEVAVNSLEIGSWISMKNRLGEQMSCRIAVIYASTGKMVIVDKSGLRVGEFLKPELVQLIKKGQAKILEQSDSFENSLARVIQSLRKDS